MKLQEQHGHYLGEIRVKVKLTNTADAAAAAAGKLPAEAVRTVEADALVDTGAIRSCVPAPLLARLGVQPVEKIMVEYAGGRKEAVGRAEGIRFEIMHPGSSDDALEIGDEVTNLQSVVARPW